MASQHVATSLLLTLPNATLTAPRYPQQQGTLSLEYLTVQVPSSKRPSLPKSEVRLILRLGSFTLPIPVTQAVLHSRIKNTYTFPTARGSVVLSLAPPASTAVAEDIELFKVVLAQYGVLWPSGGETGGNRGRTGQLVLVDSDSGLVVGSLGAEFTAKEHPNLGTEGPENDPVSIEIPEEGHQLLVQLLPFEEHSKIMKTAGLLSRGIMFATSAIASGMQSATEFYVKHSEPSKEPIVFSETTRSNIRRVHEFSEQAVKMSTKTTGFVHDKVGSIADRLAKAGSPASLTTFGTGKCAATTPSHSGMGNASDDKVSSTSYANDPSRRCPPPPPPRKKPPLVNRIALSTELLLTTMEKSADILLTQATKCTMQGFEHKFGHDMGTAAALAGKTVKNVHVLYVDARGVGRKALLKGAGKRVIKGRMGSKEIRLSTDALRVNGPSARVPSVDDWHAQAQKEVQEAVKSGHRNVRGLFGRPSAA